MDAREESLHTAIRRLTAEITSLEDELSHKTLREKLNARRQEREALLQELAAIEAGREAEHMSHARR